MRSRMGYRRATFRLSASVESVYGGERREGAIMSISSDPGTAGTRRTRRSAASPRRPGSRRLRPRPRLRPDRDPAVRRAEPRGRATGPGLLRLTRDGDPLSTLIRLFLVGVPVPLEAFRRAVAPMDPREWAALGLVEIEADAVRRLVVLTPFGPFVLAHDPEATDGRPRPDHVMGISTTTLACASMLVRPPARRALDLGTGSGYLALLAAEHSEARPGHRPESPRRGHDPLQCDAQPVLQRRDGAGEPLRAGGRTPVRPDRVQPALRGLAAGRPDVPRQRDCKATPSASGSSAVPPNTSPKGDSRRSSATGSGSPARTGSSGSRGGSKARAATSGSSIRTRRTPASMPSTGWASRVPRRRRSSTPRSTAGSRTTSRIGSRRSMPGSSACGAGRGDATGYGSTGTATPDPYTGAAILRGFAAHDLIGQLEDDEQLAGDAAPMPAGAGRLAAARARRVGLDGRRGRMHPRRRPAVRGGRQPDRLPSADALPGAAARSPRVLAQVAARLGRDVDEIRRECLDGRPEPDRAGIPLAGRLAARAVGVGGPEAERGSRHPDRWGSPRNFPIDVGGWWPRIGHRDRITRPESADPDVGVAASRRFAHEPPEVP